jgi:hypothetical protein
VDELVCCKLEEEEEARADVDLVKLEESVPLVPLVRLLVSFERGSACKLAFLSTPFELKDLGIVEEPPLLRPLILAS